MKDKLQTLTVLAFILAFMALTQTSSTYVNSTNGGSGYTLKAMSYVLSTPVNATTYYYGDMPAAMSTASGRYNVYIPVSGNITAAYLTLFASGNSGSNESMTLNIRKNGVTVYLVGTNATTSGQKVFKNTTLSIPVIQGDYIEYQLVTPTWITPPTNVYTGGEIYVST